ncbi:Csu type fimbrial protein [Burkholderia ambifaria]|uniref:Csu type fimbrial protein n=1 Tax=Burkholderia ambifaria TaxID=152480 RepID=UPI00158F0F78|nr:spore coat U domain-containing protein [Burkholderia ambifaria]WAS59070.1 spore coat U domain-containing protein [Burkholderia ambifaria]WDR98080.1 spore coat U domain-containing protein [Burkholderia ambifaria]
MMRKLALTVSMLLASPAALAACTVSASGLAFGVYNPTFATPTDGIGTVTLSCTSASGTGGYTIALDAGGGGTYAGRRMSNANSILSYQLYSDPAHSQIWGDGAGGSSIVTGTDNIPQVGGTSTYQVYGRIVARQAVSPGAYTDVIVVTVTY